MCDECSLNESTECQQYALTCNKVISQAGCAMLGHVALG
jgi:hypothetical protein